MRVSTNKPFNKISSKSPVVGAYKYLKEAERKTFENRALLKGRNSLIKEFKKEAPAVNQAIQRKQARDSMNRAFERLAGEFNASTDGLWDNIEIDPILIKAKHGELQLEEIENRRAENYNSALEGVQRAQRILKNHQYNQRKELIINRAYQMIQDIPAEDGTYKINSLKQR